jgi:membrane protein required for colicin V production
MAVLAKDAALREWYLIGLMPPLYSARFHLPILAHPRDGAAPSFFELGSVMPTYDLLMLLVLVAATIFGFYKGMAWQIAAMASFVLSYFVALKFGDQLAPVFGDAAPWNKFVAMLAIYVGCSLAIWLAFRLVSGAIDRVKLKEFDHQMGALLGLAKGVLWCVAITFFAVTLLPEIQKENILASRSGRYIVVLLNKTDAVVPPEIHEVIGPVLHRIEERLNPNGQPDDHQQDLQHLWPSQASGGAEGSDWRTPDNEPTWLNEPRPFRAEQPAKYQAEQESDRQNW